MSDASMTLQGLEPFLRTLDGLDHAVQVRGANRMLKAGGTVLAREIRKEVPRAKTPGHNNKTVKKRIGSRLVGKSRSRVGHTIKAGVGVGKKQITKGERGGWGNVLATGSKPRFTKSGAYRGRVVKDRFVQRGASKAGPPAYRKMAQHGRKFIERETAKLRRRNSFSAGRTIRGVARSRGIRL